MDFSHGEHDTKALLGWMNYHLASIGLCANDLDDDLQDGFLLLNLIDKVTHYRVGKFHPRKIGAAFPLNYYDRDNRKKVRRYANMELSRHFIDIAWSDEDLFLNKLEQLIYILFLNSMSSILPLRKSAARQFILTWANKILSEYKIVVNDFSKSWADGEALSILLGLLASTDKLQKLSKNETIGKLDLCQNLSTDILQTPLVFDVQDPFTEATETATLMYLSLIRMKHEEIQKRIENLGSTEGLHGMSHTLLKALPGRVLQDRVIRIFLSCTSDDTEADSKYFLDHAAERIQKMLQPMGVCILFVTSSVEESKKHGILSRHVPITLKLLDSCCYFVSLLGSRYGWVPNHHNPFEWEPCTSVKYPFAADFNGRSVNEYECYYAAFSPNPTATRAFFYRRHVQEDELQLTDQSRAREIIPLEEQKRLEMLQGNIHRSFQAKNYSNVDDLIEKLRNDLLESLRADAEQIKGCHEYTRKQFSDKFTGRSDLLDELLAKVDDSILVESRPVVVAGKVGSGKSAVISKLVDTLLSVHPEATVSAHYVGADGESFDLDLILSRFWDNLYASNAQSPGLIYPIWKKAYILIDGVDRLSQSKKTSSPTSLHWIPDNIPPNVVFIISVTEGHISYKKSVERQFDLWALKKLTPQEAVQIFEQHFVSESSAIPDYGAQLFSTDNATPLFATSTFHEIVDIFGEEEAKFVAGEMSKCKNTSELYRLVISFWEKRYGKEYVKQILSALLVTQSGISEYDLDCYMASRLGHRYDARLMKILYFVVYRKLESRDGRFLISNAFFRDAIKKTYLSEYELLDERKKYALWMKQRYADTESISPHLVVEISESLYAADCFEELAEFLENESVILEMLKSKRRARFTQFWAKLKARGFDEQRSLRVIGKNPSLAAAELIKYFAESKKFDPIMGLLAERIASGPDDVDEKSLIHLHCLLVSKHFEYDILASGHYRAGSYAQAKIAALKSLELKLKLFPEMSRPVASAYEMLGKIHEKHKSLSDALQCHQKCLEIRTQVCGEPHHATASAIGNVARVLYEQGQFEVALEHYIRSLDMKLAVFGETHEEIANTRNNLGSVYEKLKRYDHAMKQHNLSLQIRTRIFGSNHQETAMSHNNIGNVYLGTKRYGDALDSYTQAHRIFTATLGPEASFSKLVASNIETVKSKQANAK